MPAPPKSPAFGWSTATNGSASVTPASTRPPSRGVRQSIEVTSANLTASKSSTASVNEPVNRDSLRTAPPSVSRSPSPEKPKVSVPEVEDDDDDDEWGEMVASPPSTSRPVSGFFDVGIGTNGSIDSPLGENNASPAPTTDTSFTLDAVSSELQRGQNAAKAEATQAPPAAPAAHSWDFSAFDTKPQAPAANVKTFNAYTSRRVVEVVLDSILPTPTATYPNCPAPTSTCIKNVYKLDRLQRFLETKFPRNPTDVKTTHGSHTYNAPTHTEVITQHGPAIATTKGADPEVVIATAHEPSHRNTAEERELCCAERFRRESCRQAGR
ncbi:hypothetical protein SLS53_005023 [Cytospora paraplurivora]|uniref:Uncharacterized protein n=1 Tax=Cytospora paraplurivora TaxID=2898453 RepID=A0AAN9U6G7_9PEZI